MIISTFYTSIIIKKKVQNFDIFFPKFSPNFWYNTNMHKTIAYKSKTIISFTWNNRRHVHDYRTPTVLNLSTICLNEIRAQAKARKLLKRNPVNHET